MAVQIQIRRGTASQWTSANPTLASGELAHETDTGKIKVGDGSTAWSSLAYFTAGSGDMTGVDITAGDGLDITQSNTTSGDYTATVSADLKANGGIVIESTELAVDLGASSITGTLAAADGGTGLTSISTLLNSNTTKSDVGLGNVTNIEAQPVNADLTAIAGLTSAADKGIQFTGSGTAGVYDLTAAGKALLDDADAAAQRTTLGLGTAATSATGDFAAAAHNQSATTITSGTLAVARGGTGLTSLSTLLNSNQAYSDISGTPTLGTAAPLAVGISNNNVLQADANVADDDFLRVAGTQIEGRTAAQTLGDIGAQAALTFGKSSGNSIKSEAALDTNDFLRVGTTHVVGRTNAEVLSDIGAAAAAHTHTDSYAMFIVAPADKASPGFVVDGRVASARTITNFYAKTSGGTCTVTLRNVTDSVDIGAVSASSTGQSAGSLSNTSVAAAERLGIVITSNSSAADLELVVEYTA
jgi:hypothetical protein